MAEKQKSNEQDFWNFISILFFLLVFALIYYSFMAGNLSVFYSASFLDLFLLSFATLRIIRLLSYDKVTSFMRDFFNKRDKGVGKTAYELLICPWCTGIWVAMLIVPFYFLTEIGKIFVLIAAVAGIGSLIQVALNIMGNRRIMIG